MDDCDRCSPKNRKLTSSKDCNGVCAGKARTDTCGLCYGGNTGKLPLSTMDVCKVSEFEGGGGGYRDFFWVFSIIVLFGGIGLKEEYRFRFFGRGCREPQLKVACRV